MRDELFQSKIEVMDGEKVIETIPVAGDPVPRDYFKVDQVFYAGIIDPKNKKYTITRSYKITDVGIEKSEIETDWIIAKCVRTDLS